MPPEDVQRFYRWQAHIYDATRWAFLHGRREAIAALALRPDSTVLEVGCGTGLNFAPLVQALDPARGRLTGVDFSADMLVRARRRVRRRGWTNVAVQRADATTLALGQAFDAVLFAYSLSMIPAWRDALTHAVAHIVPGGRLVILDFGRFERWGPAGAWLRGWLRWRHVATGRDYVGALEDLCGPTIVRERRGGYYFVAEARRPGPVS